MKKFLALAVLLLVLPAMAAAALPKLDLRLTSCRDLLCVNSSDFFLPGEGAYIDYNSSVKGISYWAQLAFPDGTKYQITFPNRITSNVTGNYTVEVTAWKDGYDELTLTKVVQFVDALPQEQQVQNPPVLDWQKFLLFALAAGLTIFVVWIYSRRKKPKPAPVKKAEKKKR